jgi:hypothetical protein
MVSVNRLMSTCRQLLLWSISAKLVREKNPQRMLECYLRFLWKMGLMIACILKWWYSEWIWQYIESRSSVVQVYCTKSEDMKVVVFKMLILKLFSSLSPSPGYALQNALIRSSLMRPVLAKIDTDSVWFSVLLLRLYPPYGLIKSLAWGLSVKSRDCIIDTVRFCALLSRLSPSYAPIRSSFVSTFHEDTETNIVQSPVSFIGYAVQMPC